MVQELKNGVVGAGIVRYFEELDGRVAVAARSLGSQGHMQHDYEITFDSGLVQAYRITWLGRYEVYDASPMN